MRRSYAGSSRPSMSGIPSRVRKDGDAGPSTHKERRSYAAPSTQRSRPSSLERGSFGFAGRQQPRPRLSSADRGGTVDRHSLNQNSFIPRTGRPSSGIGVRGRTDVPKDPRPLSDKRYHSQSLNNLLEFLTSRKYPHPISQKLMGSPSNKDFYAVFEFIMGHLWKGYKPGLKIQDEVPRILKLIGYPFNVPKTYLCSVGSPHTWPHLLAALTWIIELVQIHQSVTDVIDGYMFEPADAADFDSIPDNKICFDYKERTFVAFMSGKDEFDEENEEVERILLDKNYGGNYQHILEEHKRLLGMKEDRDKAEEQMNSLKEHHQQLQQNEKSYREYFQQVQRHRQAYAIEAEKKREELEIVKSDLQQEEARLTKLAVAYDNQDLKPADVERMRAQQEHLHAQIEPEEKRIDDISKEIWQCSMDQAKKNEKLEEEVAKYNRHAIGLKVVPESAEFADGKDYRLHTGASSDVVMAFHNDVKPKLTYMKKSLSEQYRSKKKEHFRLLCEVEKMQDMVNDRKEKLTLKEKELAKMEADIEMLVQSANTNQKCEHEELSGLQQQVRHLEASLKQAMAEKQRAAGELAALQKMCQSKEQQAQQEILAMRETRKVMKGKVADHEENVARELTRVLQMVEEADAKETKLLVEAHESSQQLRKRFGLPLRPELDLSQF